MDLILWRHAEAEDIEETDELGGDDLSRRLTPRGEKQAARMAAWLNRHIPDDTRIWCSPAVRAEQTVLALGRRYRVRDELAPDGSPQGLLDVVQWPDAHHPALVVGHQPTLGRVVASLMGMQAGACAIRKGSVWWLRRRERHHQWQTIVLSVQIPEML